MTAFSLDEDRLKCCNSETCIDLIRLDCTYGLKVIAHFEEILCVRIVLTEQSTCLLLLQQLLRLLETQVSMAKLPVTT